MAGISASPAVTRNLNFLDLPRKIRDQIYYLVLVSQTGRIFMKADSRFKFDDSRSIMFMDDPFNEIRPKVTLDLLGTCRQIHAETCLIPYQRNNFTSCNSMRISTLGKYLATAAILPL
jgi:hypothetical protein